MNNLYSVTAHFWHKDNNRVEIYIHVPTNIASTGRIKKIVPDKVTSHLKDKSAKFTAAQRWGSEQLDLILNKKGQVKSQADIRREQLASTILPTLNSWADKGWFDNLPRYICATTKFHYQKSFRNYIQDDEIASLPLDKVTRLALNAWSGRLQKLKKQNGGKPLSNRSVNQIISCMASILESAKMAELILSVPQIQRIKIGKGAPEIDRSMYFSVAHYNSLLVAARALSDNVYIAFLLGGDCGLRLSESVALDWRFVDFDQNTIRIEWSKKFDGKIGLPKYGTIRIVPMTQRLRSILQSIPQKNRNSFVVAFNTYDLANITNRVTKRILGNVGHYHMFRHTFATHYARATKDIHALSKLLGHTSLTTTQQYMHNAETHEGIAALDKVFAPLPPKLRAV